MFVGVMNKGDHIISVTSELIAVERKTGEVDIIPLMKDETGLRVDIEGIVTDIDVENATVSIDITARRHGAAEQDRPFITGVFRQTLNV